MKRNGIIASILSMALLLTGCGTDSSSDIDNAQAETTTTTKATTTTEETTTTETTTTTEETTTTEATTTTEETTTAQTTTSTATSATNSDEWERAIAAGAGEAFLYISNGEWWITYDGTTDSFLSYGAGIARIRGDGEYTVSVNAGTKACQYELTGDPNSNYECEGIAFAGIKIPDGTTLYPEMSIEITEIRVDGKAVDMTAMNYTSSDDGREMRANICNPFVSTLPEDAHTADGPIGTTAIGRYSPTIIDPDDFASWTTVEVDFIVTGTGR